MESDPSGAKLVAHHLRPRVVGGAIVCALGSHAPSVLAAMTAGLDRLVAVPRRNSVVRIGVARRPHARSHADSPVIPMLLDALDLLVEAQRPTQLENYALVVGLPLSVLPAVPINAPVTAHQVARATASGLQAGLSYLLRRRLGGSGPSSARVIVEDGAGSRCLAQAMKLLQDDPTLDACVVAAADSRARARDSAFPHRALMETVAPAHPLGEASAAVWLTRRHADPTTPTIQGWGVGTDEARGHGRIRQAVRAAADRARTSVASVPLVHDWPQSAPDLLARNIALKAEANDDLAQQRWCPAMSIGDVGVASGVVQLLLAAHLARRDNKVRKALVLVSESGGQPLALVVAAPRKLHVVNDRSRPWAW